MGLLPVKPNAPTRYTPTSMGTTPPHSESVIDGSRICVTGGAGFIGSRLTRRLLELGATVTIIDDLSNAALDPIANLLDTHPDRFTFIHASILEPAALAEAISGASVVFHLAAISAAGLSLDEPTRVFDVCAAGTQRVCEAARQANVARLIYASSCSAYGRQPSPQHEQLPPEPLSPYAAAKLAGEHVVSAYAESMNLPGTSLRFFNVYGPGQPAGSAYAAVIPIFIECARKGEPLQLHGSGTQTRDFIHVDDIVRALLLAASRQDAGSGPFNIGTGQSVTIRQLAEMIRKLVGSDACALTDAPAREGDVPHSAADMARTELALGYKAAIAFEDGLAELVNEASRVTSR